MKVMMQGDDETAPVLGCDVCGNAIWDSETGAIEAEELAKLMQAHGYVCPKRRVESDGLYHRLCGTLLYHHEGNPELHLCGFCNRTISEAERVEHRFVFPSIDAMKQIVEDRAACVCGWRSVVLAVNETMAKGEWQRHPKRAYPRTAGGL